MLARPAASTVKTRLKTVKPAEQQLRVEVVAERVTASFDEVYREIGKHAVIPGFRPGKAPRELVARRHQASAREEVIRRLVADSLDEALKQEQVHVAGRVTVADIRLDERQGLSYSATIEVMPHFKLGRHKGLSLTRTPVAVTDEEVQQVLARLQEAHAEEVPVEGQAQKEKRLPALDDEFAKDVGLGSLRELTDRVRQDLLAQQETQARRQLEETLCEALLAKTAFEVPPSLVERRTEQLKRDVVVRLLLQGVTEADIPAQLQPLEAQLAANAAKLVKLSFLLLRIAETEQIAVTPEELTRHVASLATRWRCTVEQAQAHLEQERLWASLTQEWLQEKTVAWLLEHAHVE